MHGELVVREAKREEFEKLGELMVAVYSNLEGFPSSEQQPQYYDMLTHVGRLAEQPETRLLVASDNGEVIGGVVYFSDMARYGSSGVATRERGASGFRLLAVDPAHRGRGVGKALVERCVGFAKAEGQRQVILHTTRAMKIAWAMYETMGFERSPDLDFMQDELPVFGFRLPL